MKKTWKMKISRKPEVANLFSGMKKVVDYGCGSSPVSKEFIKIDKRIPGSMKKWSNMKKNSIDGIIAYSVIEHMYPGEVYIFFKHCYKILKPNGILVIHTPGYPDWNCMSHKRPYPPSAIMNFFKLNKIDDYPTINFDPEIIYWESKGFPGRRFIESFTNFLACYLKFRRRDYMIILRKK